MVEEEEEEEEPIKIAFFAGGPPGGIFGTVVNNGAMAAAEILGSRVEVTTWWSDWLPEKMITQFQQAVAMKPDGIVVYGMPGDATFEPFIEEANALGIIVTTINTELPLLEARFKGEGMGFVGADNYKAGAFLAEEIIRRVDLVEGDRVFVAGLKLQPGRGERTWGITDTFEAAGIIVNYWEISPEVNADPAAGIPVMAGFLLAYSDTKVMVMDHGGLTARIEDYIVAAGLGPDDIYGAGFDLSPAIVDAVRGGYTDLVLDQQPFMHGFLSIFQIYLTHQYGFTGLYINTAAGFVTADNIDVLAPLAEAGIR